MNLSEQDALPPSTPHHEENKVEEGLLKLLWKIVSKGLVMSETKDSVIAGSMKNLTRYIIFQSPDDPALTEAFVLTYRQFGVTSSDIMKYVYLAHKKAQQKQLDRLMNPRIICFLKSWIQAAYYTDFRKEKQLEKVMEFVCDTHFFTVDHINQIKLIFLRAHNNYFLTRKKKDNDAKYEKYEKPLDLFDISTSTLAEQLTYKEAQMYQSIQPHELLNLSWKNGATKAKNVVGIVNRSNAVSYWVAEEICICNDTRKRVTAMKKFINAAYKCAEAHNYNTTMEIMGGLNNVAVQRLKRTWAELPERYDQMWVKLTEIMDTKNNYGEYRNGLVQARKLGLPVVPFLGVFLRDLTFIEDGNPDKLGQHVNFEKIKLLGTVIQEVQAYQKVSYPYKKHHDVARYLRKSLIPPEDPADTIYDLSLLVEPKNGPVINNE